MELKSYKKYYSLERYLFEEVSNNFKKNHYLTNEEFFAIIIWKSNRAKTKVLKGIKNSNKIIKEITEKLFTLQDREKRINILKEIKGVGLPIASAILTVCFPEEFTITDYRATETISKINEKKIKNPSNSVKNYLEYVDICKKEANKAGLSLRDFDRSLWGYDFFEGKNGLKELVASLN